MRERYKITYVDGTTITVWANSESEARNIGYDMSNYKIKDVCKD